jgi:uncharacterized protein YjcR
MSKTEERKQARKLYVEEGKTGLETAAILNISTTHFYRWSHKYGWKEQKESKLLERKIMLLGLAVNIEAVLNDFQLFLNEKFPSVAESAKEAISDFLQTHNTTFNPNN